MSKNTLIGIILIGLLLFGITYLNRPKQREIVDFPQQETENQTLEETPSQQENEAIFNENDLASSQDAFEAFQRDAKEQIVTLSNKKIEVKLSSFGAMPKSVELLQYNRLQKTDKEEPLFLFKDDAARQSFLLRAKRGNIETENLYFDVVAKSSDSVVLRLPLVGETNVMNNVSDSLEYSRTPEEKTTATESLTSYLDFTYRLHPDDYILDLKISGHNLEKAFPNNVRLLDFTFRQNLAQLEKSWQDENMYSTINYKHKVSKDVEQLSNGQKQKREKSIDGELTWFAFRNKFFASVISAPFDQPLEDVKLSYTTYPKGNEFLKDTNAKGSVNFDTRHGGETRFSFFFVPLEYNMLKAYNESLPEGEYLQLHKMVNVGGKFLSWINTRLIMPVVNWLKSWISNWGLIILLLTVIIKLVLSPLTFRSYYSQAKMRILKPEVDAINKKYPGNDQNSQMKRTQETMAMYKNAGASPMAGCLPLLLQMPFLIALYRFFPSSIDLRGSSFLWVNDLSSYDPILSWDFNIPLLGDHISGFCLLWAVSNVFYSNYTMNMSSGGNEGQLKMMKWMPIIMSVMFFFFFNNYSSGLSYYYFISLLFTMVQFIISRLLINEDKLHAKLEENRKRNKNKKSRFAERLKELQRIQEQQRRR